MHPVMLLPPDADTQALRKALWHYRIGHRITDEEDGQLLWVADPRQYDELRALVARWERGDELISDAAPPKRSLPTQGLVASLRQVPVTALMILISLAVFALTGIWGDLLIVSLTIVPVGVSGGQLVYGSLPDTLLSGQVWRLLSPAFSDRPAFWLLLGQRQAPRGSPDGRSALARLASQSDGAASGWIR